MQFGGGGGFPARGAELYLRQYYGTMPSKAKGPAAHVPIIGRTFDKIALTSFSTTLRF